MKLQSQAANGGAATKANAQLDGFQILEEFCQRASDPTAFLTSSAELSGLSRAAAKSLFEQAAARLIASSQPGVSAQGFLPSLHTEGFDSEQVWNQIELQTAPILALAKSRIKKATKRILAEDAGLLTPEVLRHLGTEDGANSDEEQRDGDDGASSGSDEERGAHGARARAKHGDDAHEGDSEEDGEEASGSEGRSEGEEGGDEGSEEDGEDEDDEAEEEEEEEEEGAPRKKAKAGKVPGDKGKANSGAGEKGRVEDDFFKLDDMERFVRGAEKSAMGDGEEEDEEEEDNEDEDDEDDEEDDGDEDDGEGTLRLFSKGGKRGKGRDIRYEDFFGPGPGAKGKGGKGTGVLRRQQEQEEEEDAGGGDDAEHDSEDEDFLDEDADEDEDAGEVKGKGGTEKKSAFELAQEKMAKRTAEMEEGRLGDQEWHMAGEVRASKRPVNSLLDMELDFEHAQRPAPVITAEVTASLEELIRGRIKDKLFDNPERKLAPVTRAPKERTEIDENKSAKGLAEIYEEAYVKVASGGSAVTTVSEADAVKKEATELFKSLCAKLDALSHFFFSPKPVIEDMGVREDVPALAMEEVAPVTASTASMLAPEEVFKGGDGKGGAHGGAAGALKGPDELTREERRAARQKRKRQARGEREEKDRTRVAKEKTAGLQPGALLPVAKGGKADKAAPTFRKGEKSEYTQSSKLFAQLQEQKESGAGFKRPAKTDTDGAKPKAGTFKL
eukprot:jgi/Mesvir1/589/Mv02031-RA.1